ncbi:hypothetical protein CH282_15675 [Rhodococcus sp. 06-418-1B]|nr:NAD(P)/FAD-dependent oxidoreductase [Rhodococcus sp. 06-418-1B]OZC83400.1 hypothetical protein CH282_15675 [Rhodococcus sp. 06-418-1B]
MHLARVAISGAGLAGLTLARILYRAGLDVTVYERDRTIDSRYAGYRVHINSSGTTALREALDTEMWQAFVASAGTPADDMKLFDEQLRPGPERSNRDSAGIGRSADDIPEHLAVCRETIRRLLLLGFETNVQFASQVVGYTELPCGRVRVHLDDGRSDDVDLLVAADGINSAVRAQRLPHMKVVDLGSRHVAAKVPLNDDTVAQLPPEFFCLFALASNADKDGLTFGPMVRNDPGHRALKSLPSDLRAVVANNYALSIFNTTAAKCLDDNEFFALNGTQLKQYVRTRTASWDHRLQRVVELWDADTAQALALRSCVPVDPWAPSNITMIGDSVHAMSSALGIGANTALRDAFELGIRIRAAARSRSNIVGAVADYENIMRDYAFNAVRASARIGQWVIGHDDIVAPDASNLGGVG